MFRYTEDVEAASAEYDAELQRLEYELPFCEICEKPVMDDFYYEINDTVICAECMDKQFKKQVVID